MASNRLCLSERRQGFLVEKVMYVFSNYGINAKGTITLSDKPDRDEWVVNSEQENLHSEERHIIETRMKEVLSSTMYKTLCYKIDISIACGYTRPEVVFDLITAQRKN